MRFLLTAFLVTLGTQTLMAAEVTRPEYYPNDGGSPELFNSKSNDPVRARAPAKNKTTAIATEAPNGNVVTPDEMNTSPNPTPMGGASETFDKTLSTDIPDVKPLTREAQEADEKEAPLDYSTSPDSKRKELPAKPLK